MKDIKLLQQNIVLLAGYLGQDPDFRSTGSGRSLCKFSLGVSRRWRDKASGDWKDETSWIPVTVWGEAADRLRDKLKKGSPVHVEGRLQSRKYEKDGQSRTGYDVIANRVQFLTRMSAEGGGSPASGGGDESLEEVPF